MSIIVKDKTIQIQANAVARLSPDIGEISDTFAFRVDKKSKKLWLDGSRTARGSTRLRVYASNGRSRSRYLNLRYVLKEYLGINPKDVRGKLYDVQVNGKTVEVQF